MSSYPPPPGQGDGPAYPPPPGNQPPWGAYGPVPNPGHQQAVWALTIAIIGLVSNCCCGVLSIVGAIVAIVLAQASKKEARLHGGPYADTSLATAAWWIGIAGLALGVLSVVASGAILFFDVAGY